MDSEVQRFGQVEFLAAKRKLRVAGRQVDLDRPAAAILALLVEDAGRDVDKNRLLEAGWPGRVVDENSLAKAIWRLRTTLGDDGRALETVHGFGYRLAADVSGRAPITGERPIARGHKSRVFVSLGAMLFGLAAWQLLDSVGGSSSASRSVINGEPPDTVGRILWVDDHPENNVAEKHFLEQHKIGVYEVRATDDALKLLRMYAYGAVISDMGRGDRPLAGMDLLQAMRSRGDRPPFFLYTVHSSSAQRRLVAESGGQAVAVTPDQLYNDILPLFGRDERPTGPAPATG